MSRMTASGTVGCLALTVMCGSVKTRYGARDCAGGEDATTHSVVEKGECGTKSEAAGRG